MKGWHIDTDFHSYVHEIHCGQTPFNITCLRVLLIVADPIVYLEQQRLSCYWGVPILYTHMYTLVHTWSPGYAPAYCIHVSTFQLTREPYAWVGVNINTRKLVGIYIPETYPPFHTHMKYVYIMILCANLCQLTLVFLTYTYMCIYTCLCTVVFLIYIYTHVSLSIHVQMVGSEAFQENLFLDVHVLCMCV